MRAIAIDQFGDRDVLQSRGLPLPEMEEGDVLIRIQASGVNPVDWKIRQGLLQGRMPHEFPIILGWECAGVIDRVGEKVTRFKIGDEVMSYVRGSRIHTGTYAEYIAVPEERVALKPPSLSFAEAAVIPLAGLTAYQSLHDALQLKAGEAILIHAGAGGVGGYAIQLAKQIGAHVITTASEGHHEYVSDLGADEVIDYTKTDFCAEILKKHPEGVDAVYDTVGDEVQTKSYEVLKAGGRLVSILELQEPELWQEKGYAVHYVFVAPNAAQLEQLGRMAEKGHLKICLSKEYPLAEVVQAHQEMESGHVRGKIALII